MFLLSNMLNGLQTFNDYIGRGASQLKSQRLSWLVQLLAWQSLMQQTLGLHIEAGDEITVTAYTNTDKIKPSLGVIDDNRFVVAWGEETTHDGSSNSITIQLFDINGTALTGDIAVNIYTSGDRFNPSVGVLDSNRFVVAWEGKTAHDESNYSIVARLFDAEGRPLTGEIAINAYTSDSQRNPSVGVLDSNCFVVAWAGKTADDTSYGIVARLFDAEGRPLTDDIAINAYTSASQWRPSIGVLDSSRFVVAWGGQTAHDPGLHIGGIAARVFDANGTALTGDITVNIYTGSHQWNPSVGVLDSNRFVVTWDGYTAHDRNKYGIATRVFDANGTALTGDIAVNAYTKGHQKYPTVGPLIATTLSSLGRATPPTMRIVLLSPGCLMQRVTL